MILTKNTDIVFKFDPGKNENSFPILIFP